MTFVSATSDIGSTGHQRIYACGVFFFARHPLYPYTGGALWIQA